MDDALRSVCRAGSDEQSLWEILMRSLAAILAFFLLPAFAQAQSVQQSGLVTPGHMSCWVVSGVVADCGTPSSPFATTFGVVNGNFGSIAINSAPISGAYTAFDLGVSSVAAAIRDTAV